MKFSEISESTTAGSVASVAMPLGNTQKRTGSLFKGKKTKKKFYESEVSEAEVNEADLILMPGQLKGKDKSFIPHDQDRRDHEVEMARSELFAAAKDAQRIYKMLQGRTEDEGLMGWQQSYITLASDYLNSVADSIEYNAKVKGSLDEMTGGVLAGGMSNFEEGVAEGWRQEQYKQRGINSIMDLVTPALSALQSNKPLDGYISSIINYVEDNNLENDPRWKQAKQKSTDEYMKWYKSNNMPSANTEPELKRQGEKLRDKLLVQALAKTFGQQGVAEEKCPHCGGEMVSEELINEKKDACYYKVKSRYKVWPSAYASGALVKCRKKGASNWGKSKK